MDALGAGRQRRRHPALLPLPCSQLYKAYELWCDHHGERKRGMKDLISLAGKNNPDGGQGKRWAPGPPSTTAPPRTAKIVIPTETAVDMAWKAHRHDWHRPAGPGQLQQPEGMAHRLPLFAFEQAMGLEA